MTLALKRDPRDDLIWSDAGGFGYYPVQEPERVYDQSYFAKYQGYARTERGQALTRARVDLVRRFAGNRRVIDFGIGAGQFVDAHGNARGYDINPVAIAWLKARGLYTDPYRDPVWALTAWDSLEHIPAPGQLIARVRSLVFVSTPIYHGLDHVLRSKHFRPDEHFWYWTAHGLRALFDDHGFDCVHVCRMEERHGREDILTAVFRRRED